MSYFNWETKISIFKNRFILKEIGIAVGIPFGLLIAFIIYVSKGDIFGTDAKYAIGLIAILFTLTALFLLVVYKGKYAPGFIVDNEGIVNYTQKNQAKTNFVVNMITIILGLFRGDFTVAGAGMLAHSRQVVKIKWKNVRKVKYYPKQYTVYVKGGFAEKIAVFCNSENYDEVSKFIFSKTLKNTKFKEDTPDEEI